MTLSDLNELSLSELKRLKRINSLSYHSFMLASVGFFGRAFSEIDALILLISFGLAIIARAFYSNARMVESLQHARSKA